MFSGKCFDWISISQVEIKLVLAIGVTAVSSGVIVLQLARIYLINYFSPISETFKVMNNNISFID